MKGQIDPEVAALALRMVMEVISESRYLAGWDTDLDRFLWRDVTDGKQDEETRIVRGLSEAAGGWFVWDHEKHEPRFVNLDDWMKESP